MGRGIIVLLAALLLPLPARAVPPRMVPQFGHISPVDAAAWIPDVGGWPAHSRLLTGDAQDNSIIIWGALYGNLIDRLLIPDLDAAGLFENQRVLGITISPDAHSAWIRLHGLTRNADNSSTAATFGFRLDLDTRRFDPPVRSAGSTDPSIQIAYEGMAALPVSLDGKVRLRRNGATIEVRSVADGKLIQRLGDDRRNQPYSVDLAPGGGRIVTLGIEKGNDSPDAWATRMWDAQSGQASPMFAITTDNLGEYSRVRWLGRDRYAIIAAGQVYPFGGGHAPTLVIDALTAKLIGPVPGRCMTTPVGDDGRFAAAGPASCNTATTDGKWAAPAPMRADGLWLFDRSDAAGAGFTLARAWRQHIIPELAGQIITALTAGADGHSIIAATRAANPNRDGSFRLSLFTIPLDGGAVTGGVIVAAAQPSYWPNQQSGIQKLVPTPGATALIHRDEGLALVSGGAERQHFAVRNAYPEIIGSDGKTMVFAARDFQMLQRFDVASGRRIAPLPVPGGVLNGGFEPGLPLIWAIARDGALRLWDTRVAGLGPLLTYFSFPQGRYFVVRSDGRYDTNIGADASAVRWLMPDAQWKALPAEFLMRSHYEPALFRKVLDCLAAEIGGAAGRCAESLTPLPELATLNRAMPVPRIMAITPGDRVGMLTVDVGALAGDYLRPDGSHQSSGVHDLRLLRNGRLVGQWPDRSLTPAEGRNIDQWRKATAIGPDTTTHRFPVALPSGTAAQHFSVYAYNSDRVKTLASPASNRDFTPALPAFQRSRRAFVIAIGVDRTANPDWRLNYAANDARAMVKALASIPDRDQIIPILLTSTDAVDHATKAHVSAVLRLLNGFGTDADRALLRDSDIDPAPLTTLTPDDIVIISFSGHGDTIDGEFYLVPSDAVAANGKPVLASLMSSTELTTWARHVDAAELTLIIDACHSAASVDQGAFKPGPMGDPGLGQLAYDKGIRVLAAAQSDDVALEDGGLGHGLLTYALASKGLPVAADSNGDGQLTMAEWLAWGVAQVPVLATELASGQRRLQDSTSRDLEDEGAPARRTRSIQQPALFDFNAGPGIVLMRRQPAIRTAAAQP